MGISAIISDRHPVEVPETSGIYLRNIDPGREVIALKPLDIIEKYYPRGAIAHLILVEHSNMVAKKALEIARVVMHLDPDVSFIKDAAMLHDIGIFLTSSPGLGCFCDKPYVCHGYLGRELLESEGLPGHALVCERHVGAGISCREIERLKLPIPRRDMLPVSIEEKIVCYADKFFSKKRSDLPEEKSLEKVRREIGLYGEDVLQRFDEMAALFGGKSPDHSG